MKWRVAAAMAGSMALLPMVAAASPWAVCDARIEVLGTKDQQLSARVLSVTHRQGASCALEPLQTIAFTPETPDYQSTLPRRHWPQAGRIALLRHRYLDGFCKNDGHEKPCRIAHFSILSRPTRHRE